MSCCGQKRQQWQQQMVQPQAALREPEPGLENPVSIQYRGPHSYMIKGPATGLLYLFAGNGNSLMVNSRDVKSILVEENFALA